MKTKRDPIFGVRALEELGSKLKAAIKPNPPLKQGKLKRKIRNTRLFKQRMHYLYTGEEEDSEH